MTTDATSSASSASASAGPDRYDLLVIGSGPAGVSAVRGYRDAGGTGAVLLVSSDEHPPYERPPLSKDVLAGESAPEPQPIGGEPVPDDVEVRLETTVTSVDLAARRVRLGGAEVGFERLVVASGSVPKALPDVEQDAEVHLLRSLAQAQRLLEAAEHARTAVVIGSGFIGCEAAASLSHRGVQTTIVTPEEAPHAARLGDEAAARIAAMLTGAGIELRTGVQVTSIEVPRAVHLDDGTTLSPDLVLSAIGVAQTGDLLAGTEAEQSDGRIIADEHLRAAPAVWVAGDVASAHHAVAGRPIAVEHWGDALTMGELAGRNAAADQRGQEPAPWDAVPGFWSTIGPHTLKYSAWGDGYETSHLVEHDDGFTVWYADDEGELVGVLTYQADEDYERGGELIGRRATTEEAIG